MEGRCCELLGFDVWLDAGGGQSRVNGHYGVTQGEWNGTLGIQRSFCNEWTFGIAGSYEHHSLTSKEQNCGDK